MRNTILLLFTLIMVNAYSQDRGRPVTLSAGLEIGIPMGEFRDSFGREFMGLSGDLTMPMRVLPFDWGFDFAWGRMGGERKQVPIQEEHILATEGNLRIHSDIFGYHGLLRLKPFNGKFSPYIEGLAGVRQFTTKTRINVDGLDQPLFEQRNSNEFIWSHGWAAGLQLAPTKAFYVEARVERLNGGKVQYVDPTSIQVASDGAVGYTTLTSGARVLNVHLGVGLRF